MPVAPNRNNPARQAVTVLVAGLLGFVALFFLITRVYTQASEGDININIGDDRFLVGDAEELAAKIDDEDIFGGDPLLFPGQANDRDIWVQHIGDDPLTGWLAFAARADDAPRSCTAEWMRDSETFVDSCDGTIYPPDGEGLRRYPVEIAQGQIFVTIVERTP